MPPDCSRTRRKAAAEQQGGVVIFAVLTVIVLLGVLIFVHELGHFGAAKAVGIAVERFSIGLGPRVWGFTRRGTEYVVAAIPLGGYVKMQGMHDDVMEKLEGGDGNAPREPRPDDFDAQSILARTFVISAGVIMNMLFAAAVFVLVPAVWGVPDLATTRVMAVDESALPPGTERLAGIEPGARVARAGGTEPRNWGDVRRFLAGSPAGPATVVTEEPAGVFRVDMPESAESRRALAAALEGWMDPVVGSVRLGSPAEKASLEAGDRIVSVAGAPVRNWRDLTKEVGGRPGERVEVEVERDGERLVRMAELEAARTGVDGETRGALGVFPAPEIVDVPVSLGDAAALGVAETFAVARQIVGFVGALVTLQASPRSLGSIGTITVMSNDAARQGFAAYLRFMALFSVNLAVLNMLPIPVLDGGHMVFIGIEAVRGRKLTATQRLRWSQVGLAVVVGIMVLALGNDLVRFLPF